MEIFSSVFNERERDDLSFFFARLFFFLHVLLCVCFAVSRVSVSFFAAVVFLFLPRVKIMPEIFARAPCLRLQGGDSRC